VTPDFFAYFATILLAAGIAWLVSRELARHPDLHIRAMSLFSGPGAWNYAGCCGCGRCIVHVFTVHTVAGIEQAHETWCRRCFTRSEILPTIDHIVLDEPLVMVPNREADRVFDEALHARKAGAR
jgi:hypothetical protein